MKEKLNVVIIGSGGREHALAWKIAQSSILDTLYIAPGNAGTARVGTNIDLNPVDFASIREFALGKDIDVILVGPEDPLVYGIYDFIKKDPSTHHICVIGPSAAGALLEGSKDFAKQFMQKYSIPTASYATFDKDTFDQALTFLRSMQPPYVLKADGLAAGKGVVICDHFDQAAEELKSMLLDEKFGKASSRVVIEQFLKGIELSAFALTDGSNYLMLPEAKDYKRIGENDTGLNTGGMGSVSPVSFADPAFMQKVEERIIRPTVEGLKQEGITYKGFIFAGLMNVEGDPFVIEYNVRLGDPETESVLPRIKSDLLEILLRLENEELSDVSLDIDPMVSATVMLVSGGYPGSYQKGLTVDIPDIQGCNVFHAGTARDKVTGEVLTSGGRVIAVNSLGKDLDSALKNAYDAAARITFGNKYYRSDIGFDLKQSS
jgi:phosphoribosylamine--glycine ligase